MQCLLAPVGGLKPTEKPAYLLALKGGGLRRAFKTYQLFIY